MGRKQTIDRSALLDAADRVILRSGTDGLTIDAVALEAEVSKGGVLYAFSTKDGLIEALLERSMTSFVAAMRSAQTSNSNADIQKARAHVFATTTEDLANAQRAMALLAGLAKAPAFQQRLRDWYTGVFELQPDPTVESKKARIAMLAAEALFMLRGFGLLPLSDDLWKMIFEDIEEILLVPNA
jgi:AcrR family transcriptional regulator